MNEIITIGDIEEEVLSLSSYDQYRLAMELAEDNLTIKDLTEVADKIGGRERLLDWIDDEVIREYINNRDKNIEK